MTQAITATSIVSGGLKSLKQRPSLIIALALAVALMDQFLLLPLVDLVEAFQRLQSSETPTQEEASAFFTTFIEHLPLILAIFLVKALLAAFCITMWVRATWPGLEDRFTGGLSMLLRRALRASKYFLYAMASTVILTVAVSILMALLSLVHEIIGAIAFLIGMMVIFIFMAAFFAVAIFGALEAALDKGKRYRQTWQKTQAFHQPMVVALVMMFALLHVAYILFFIIIGAVLPGFVAATLAGSIVAMMGMLLASGMAPIYAAVHKDSDLKA